MLWCKLCKLFQDQLQLLCEMIVAQGSVTQWNQPIKMDFIQFLLCCTWLQVLNGSWLWSHWEINYQFACAWKYAWLPTFSANRYPKWWNHGRSHVPALCERLDKKPSSYCGDDVLLREWRILEGKTVLILVGSIFNVVSLLICLAGAEPRCQRVGPSLMFAVSSLDIIWICHDDVWIH